MRFRLPFTLAFALSLLALLLPACPMPPLPVPPPQNEDGLLLKNVRLHSAQGSQLQLLGEFAEVRFCAEKRLLKSSNARIWWLAEKLLFQAEYLDARLDSQEAWAPAYWKFQTEDDSFGEGTDAYGHKDSLGNMYARTPKPLRLWQHENALGAKEAHCEVSIKNCEFLGAVKTTLSKAN